MKLALLLVLVTGSTALADSPNTQALRKQAEQLAGDATASHDLAKFVEAGKAYLEIYDLDPTDSRGDELLYNAGVAFAEGRSIAPSIQAFEAIRKRFPMSRLVAKAITRIGKAYADLAMYDRAAGYFEEYAARYAGEKDARDALRDAVFYRKAVGDHAKAIEDTSYFIKTFGAKYPQEAANAMWSLTSVYEARADDDRLVKHLRAYLARFGDKGGADRVVIAHAKIGQRLWQQSCAGPLVDGLCTNLRRRRGTSPSRCSPGPDLELTLVARDPGKLKEALAELALAVKELEQRNGATGGDEAAARYYYGLAKLVDADHDLEAFVAVRFPSDLKRFSEWLEQTKRRGQLLTRKYEAVLAVKDAASSITAAARLGQVSQRFFDALITGDIPRSVATGEHAVEKVAAYCSAMTEAAEPLRAREVEAYSVCLAKSTELGWYSDSSKLCERELVRMKPAEFPKAVELRGAPLFTAPIIVVESLP